MENQGEIILYQPDSEVKLEVRLEEETVWLNRQQLSELFNRDIKTIGKHVNNALKEELAGMSTVAKFATVQKEGDRTVTRQARQAELRRNGRHLHADRQPPVAAGLAEA